MASTSTIAVGSTLGGKPFRLHSRRRRAHGQACINESIEREAKRIAQMLHDEAGQMLAIVHMRLDQVARDVPTFQRAELEDIQSMLSNVEEGLRRLSHELRPTILDHLGLVPALEFLADGVAKKTGLVITIDSSIEGRLPSAKETALYRVVQEALTNVSKHARARRVRIRLSATRQIQCKIEDDGVGVASYDLMTGSGTHGLGLIGMRERIENLEGTFHISSAPGRGTKIVATIPLEAPVVRGLPGIEDVAITSAPLV